MLPDGQSVLEGVWEEAPEGGLHELRGGERCHLLVPRLLPGRHHAPEHLLNLRLCLLKTQHPQSVYFQQYLSHHHFKCSFISRFQHFVQHFGSISTAADVLGEGWWPGRPTTVLVGITADLPLPSTAASSSAYSDGISATPHRSDTRSTMHLHGHPAGKTQRC